MKTDLLEQKAAPDLTDLVGLPLHVGDKFAFASWGYGVPSALCQSYCVITRITRTGGIEYESKIELKQKRTLAAKHVKTMTRKLTEEQSKKRGG